MEIEKIAVNAVESSIIKAERLTSFISRGDKEPCWDGNVYIHESQKHNKRNIKKVSTQIKGKAVTCDQVSAFIKYRISHDDLSAYMTNGGTMFFVVYVDKVTGDPLQIYYTDLLPIKIKDILRKEQKSYEVRFSKFPEDNSEKTAVFINFHNDALRQASFADKDLPSIEDLAKQGILESLTFSCTGYGNYRSPSSVPKIMDGKSLSIYANVKGYSCPVPVKYHECIHQVTMSAHNFSPITIDGKQYYDGFKEITNAEHIDLCIGSCVKITFPNCIDENRTVPTTLSIKVCGTLKQQIAGLEFIIAMIEHKNFYIGKHEFPVNFPDDELKKIRADQFEKILTGYKRAQELLDCMNVKKDLDIQKCNDKDIDKLNMLIATICEQRPVKGAPPTTENVQEIHIGNLLLAVVYLKRNSGGYNIFDYFGSHFNVVFTPNNSQPMPISQFVSMVPDDFLRFDNLNLKTIIEDYKRLNATERNIEEANSTMLNMLKAYDKKPSSDLLDAAEQLSDWLQEYPMLIKKEIAALNRLQIVLRKRSLTHQEKSEIYAILASTKDEFIQLGSFILLGEYHEASKIIDSLDNERAERFTDFPIYEFYRNQKKNREKEKI